MTDPSPTTPAADPGSSAEVPPPATEAPPAEAAPSRWDRVRAWRPRTDLAVATVSAVAVFLVLLFRYRWVLTRTVHFGGDEGNQFGIALDAVTLRELRGGGSRTGFHHPGPGYFYVWGLADGVRKVLHLPVWRDNAEMIGGAAFVAAQLGTVVALVRAHLTTAVRGVVVLVAMAALALDPGLIGGPWLPHMYYVSFALLLVAGASTAAGRLWSLPIFAVAVVFLFHGHIAFSSFVGVATLLLVVWMWRRGELGRLWREQRSALWVTVGIVVAFALPIVVYTLRDWPGEIGRYVDYMRSDDTGGNSLADGIRYTLQFWPGSSTWGRAALAVASWGALVGLARWRRSVYAGALAVGVAAMELCLLQYAMSGVDDLSYRYAAIWAYAMTGVTVGTVVALVLPDRLCAPRRAIDWAALGVLGAVAVYLVQDTTGLRYRPVDLNTAPEAVDLMEERAEGEMIVIDATLAEAGTYLLVPAVLSVAEDRGLDICLLDREWEIKYGDWRICTRDEARDGVPFAFYDVQQPLPDEVEALDPPVFQSAYMVAGERRVTG